MNIFQKLYNFFFSQINSLRYFLKEKFLYNLIKKKSINIIKKKEPLISIIMPTYNRSKILSQRGIPTVLNQTYKKFELIVVSHQSTDNTEKIVKSFNDSRIKFFNIERKKKYPANLENHWACHSVEPTNFGMKKANGDWIAHIDDDDFWTKDHLEKLLKFAQKNKYEFVSSSHIEIRLGKKIIKSYKKNKPPIGAHQTWLYTSNLKFFERNINCWRRSWNRLHDVDVQDRMTKVGLNFGYIDIVTYTQKPRPGERQVGILAIRENKYYYNKIYKFK